MKTLLHSVRTRLSHTGGTVQLLTLLQLWLKANSVILLNGMSLIGTTAVTSILGFVYWWAAARLFSPEAVGLSSAAISAMTLLATIGIVGLGTLLIGELPRQKGKEIALINAALIAVGGISAALGVVFAIVAPLVTPGFRPIGASIGDIALFTAGVSLTAITIVLDEALIGLLRGEQQFWRNTVFAALKLVAIYLAALWLAQRSGMAIYATWALGNALSLVALVGFALLKGRRFKREHLPEWGLLRKLGPAASKHHALNLALQAPALILPVLVTVLLSTTTNAWFYVSWRIAAFTFVVPTALPTVLYAISAAQPAVLARKTRLTVGLSTMACLLASIILLLFTRQVLSLFGPAYIHQAEWSLRILGLGAFPLIVKNHYIAVCRAQGRIGSTTLPLVGACLLELGAAALGAFSAGLTGLSLGWLLAMCVEALLMSRTLYKAMWPKAISTPLAASSGIKETEAIWLIDTITLPTVKLGRKRATADVSTNGAHQHYSSNGQRQSGEVEDNPSPGAAMQTGDSEAQSTFLDENTAPLESLQMNGHVNHQYTESTMENVSDPTDDPEITLKVSRQKFQFEKLARKQADAEHDFAASIMIEDESTNESASAKTNRSQEPDLARTSHLVKVKFAPLPLVKEDASLQPPYPDLQPRALPDDWQPPVLQGIDLSAQDLSYCYLVRADLSGAQLAHANLTGADLSGANLSCANLLGSILIDANLYEADLQNANLKEANLVGAHNLIEEQITAAIHDATTQLDSEVDVTLKCIPIVRPTETPSRTTTPLAHFVPVEKTPIRSSLRLAEMIHLPIAIDLLSLLFPVGAFILWSLSLKYVDFHHMTGLGLVSVLPPSLILALVIMAVSFCITLQRPQLRVPIILLHFALLIFMLYGITTLVEQAPRFSIVYRHAGYTEYIMRTGGVDPNLDAYFNWPGFFIFSAFLTRVAGYTTILSYASWAPVFLNLIYLAPMYVIFTSATTNKRVVWLGLWFFYLTNWIAQDYFSPQGLDFFFYLVIIAILVKWFKVPPATQPRTLGARWQRLGRLLPHAQKVYVWLTAPDPLYTPTQPRLRAALLAIIIILFSFVVYSHPLTPFFVIASVTTLAVLGRCKPLWLPVLMMVMTVVWIVFMAQTFLVGHMYMVIGDFGHFGSSITQNVTSRVVQGDPAHAYVATIRVVMTLLVWGLAFLGALLRLYKGHRDITYIVLAVIPFPLLVAQSYGGEMLLRIYLFSLPPMVLFAASLFYTPLRRKTAMTATHTGLSRWRTTAIIGITLVLLGGFLFTRYGNESMDYMTYNEVNGVHYLYSIAPPHSLFLAGWDGTPWQFQDYEKYDTYSLSDYPDFVANKDVNAIVQFLTSQSNTHDYVIFTRSQKATVNQTSGLAPGSLDQLENALHASGKFKLLYSNPDAQIFILDLNSKGGNP